MRLSRLCPFINRQVQLHGFNPTGPKRLAQVDGFKKTGPNRQVQIDRSKIRIQTYWSKYLGQRRQVQIEGSKETDPKQHVQIDRSKKTGQNRLVQEARMVQIYLNSSNIVKNELKKQPNGFGITRSPGLVYPAVLVSPEINSSLSQLQNVKYV